MARVNPEVAKINRLEAAQAGRAKAVEKREAHLRMRLDEAQQEMARLRKRISKLRKKVNYYDRKAAKR